MQFVNLEHLIPIVLLALRIVIAVIFFSSGRSHLEDPIKRGESIDLSPDMTRIIGILEIIAAISIAFGIVPQVGATIILIIMIGAIKKKIVDWNVGFYSQKGFGWHYDIIFLVAALMILVTNGGKFILY